MRTLTREQPCNPGVSPDWELYQRPFTLRDYTQPTEPHRSGAGCFSLAAPINLWTWVIVSFIRKQGKKQKEKSVKGSWADKTRNTQYNHPPEWGHIFSPECSGFRGRIPVLWFRSFGTCDMFKFKALGRHSSPPRALPLLCRLQTVSAVGQGSWSLNFAAMTQKQSSP